MWFHIGDARSLKEPQKKSLDFSFLGGNKKKLFAGSQRSLCSHKVGTSWQHQETMQVAALFLFPRRWT